MRLCRASTDSLGEGIKGQERSPLRTSESTVFQASQRSTTSDFDHKPNVCDPSDATRQSGIYNDCNVEPGGDYSAKTIERNLTDDVNTVPRSKDVERLRMDGREEGAGSPTSLSGFRTADLLAQIRNREGDLSIHDVERQEGEGASPLKRNEAGSIVVLTENADSAPSNTSESGVETRLEPTDEEVLMQTQVKNLDTNETTTLADAQQSDPISATLMERRGPDCDEKSIDTISTATANSSQGPHRRNRSKTTHILHKFGFGSSKNSHSKQTPGSPVVSLHDESLIKQSVKGKAHFSNLRKVQSLTPMGGPIWTMKFSVDGKLLAAAGQDRIVRVWVVKGQEGFFDDMKNKYNNSSRSRSGSASQVPTAQPASKPDASNVSNSHRTSNGNETIEEEVSTPGSHPASSAPPPRPPACGSPTTIKRMVEKSRSGGSDNIVNKNASASPKLHTSAEEKSQIEAVINDDKDQKLAIDSSTIEGRSSTCSRSINRKTSNPDTRPRTPPLAHAPYKPHQHTQKNPQLDKLPQTQSDAHSRADDRNSIGGPSRPEPPKRPPPPSATKRQTTDSKNITLNVPSSTENLAADLLPDTQLKPFFNDEPYQLFRGHNADVLDISWSKDDRYFLSASLDCRVRLWSITQKKVALWNLVDNSAGNSMITSASFVANGRMVAVGTYDGRCLFYDSEKLKYHTQILVKRKGKKRGKKISGIASVGDGDRILVTSNDSRIRMYDLSDFSLKRKFRGGSMNSGQLRASVSGDTNFVISGSETNNIYMWKTNENDGNKTRYNNDACEAYASHRSTVTVALFAPYSTFPNLKEEDNSTADGEVIVSADYSGCINIQAVLPLQMIEKHELSTV
ncbi:hypothetical protein SARC_12736 [Sphaeroforma arctica JP610]|uniref:Anaphase-promoting complex subunit 4 WD40 domain-containing protein n=1 Tax=Sphaeroforma arctica JP610 TaxID=667725 RepID=A0A0L0FDA8_9EUKA|nr:hypothetical protein SARC_12736 [Sphaeroforma arctica JP610]KNC74725.1 hypothetical protein SARC_12736 [Sphaeroforma arctica JP610]|eukprot:XP_014148627.1 hypothetical protein SARC_12736 [Sphaeroforma arctica JP610]